MAADCRNGKSRWVTVGIPVFVAALAFAVQWGIVNAKLGALEKRLDEFLSEARTLRTEYQVIERRLSYLEGRINGKTAP